MRQVWFSMIITLLVLGIGGPVAFARQHGGSFRHHCAWVLWQKVGRHPGAWEVLNSYESRGKCKDKLKKYAKKSTGPTDMIDIEDNRATVTDVSGTTIIRTLLCLPDRLYPSVPLH